MSSQPLALVRAGSTPRFAIAHRESFAPRYVASLIADLNDATLSSYVGPASPRSRYERKNAGDRLIFTHLDNFFDNGASDVSLLYPLSPSLPLIPPAPSSPLPSIGFVISPTLAYHFNPRPFPPSLVLPHSFRFSLPS